MPDSLMVEVANALAGKVTEVAFDSARRGWDALVRLVRKRFAREPYARDALDAAQEQPDDPGRIQALADALERVAAADDDFAEETSVAVGACNYQSVNRR